MMEIDLAFMRKIDVRDVDPETLVDISDIRIDLSQPPEQRMASLIQQMNGDPYFFRSEGLIVKTSSIIVSRVEIKKGYELNIQLAPDFERFLDGLIEMR